MDKAAAEQVLNIKENPYTATVLQKHYKLAVKKAHPDCGGSHEQMVEVNAAYNCLSNIFMHQEKVNLSPRSEDTSWSQMVVYWEQELKKRQEEEKQRKETGRRTISEEIVDAAKAQKRYFYVIMAFRLLLLAIAAITFVDLSGIDFIVNIGSFHYFNLYQGTFGDLVWSSAFMTAAIFNLFVGSITDWIPAIGKRIVELVRKGKNA